MPKKQFLIAGSALIVVLIVAAALSVLGQSHNSTLNNPIAISTNSSSLAVTVSSTGVCDTDFSDFMVPPLPTSSYNWIEITEANATTALGVAPAFSSSTGEMINPESFWVSSPKSVSTTLEGQAWYSPGSTQIPQSYYQSVLTQQGWIGQLNIASDTLYAMDAGGYHGIVWGFMKVENGYFRAIEIDESIGAPDPTNVNIFLSDIFPLSQIIPGYQPICPNVTSSISQVSSSTYPSIQGEYHVNLPNQLMLVDSQGRRTGEDPATGVVYREIPNTNYGDLGDGELFTSNIPNGQYTLYVLGATSTYWLDAELTGQHGAIFRGSITPGSMIAYVQNYNTTDIASSTFSVSSTVSSTASITTAPPNNWTPPAIVP